MEMHNNIPGGTLVAILYARCFYVSVFFLLPLGYEDEFIRVPCSFIAGLISYFTDAQ